jgi:hypothetical protein
MIVSPGRTGRSTTRRRDLGRSDPRRGRADVTGQPGSSSIAFWIRLIDTG